MMLLHNVLPSARWQTTTTNSFTAFSKSIAYLLSSIFLKPVSMTRKDNYSVEHLFPLLLKPPFENQRLILTEMNNILSLQHLRMNPDLPLSHIIKLL